MAGGAGGAAGALASNSLAVRIANYVMSRWSNPDAIAGQLAGWEYNHGIVLRGIEGVWRHTNDARYLTYIQNYVDRYVNASGSVPIPAANMHSFDNMQPSIFLPLLYQQTGMAKYKTAADSVHAYYASIPTNSEGGYWHKQQYPEPDVAGQHLHGRAVPDALCDRHRDLRHLVQRYRLQADAADRAARARHEHGPPLSRLGRQHRDEGDLGQRDDGTIAVGVGPGARLVRDVAGRSAARPSGGIAARSAARDLAGAGDGPQEHAGRDDRPLVPGRRSGRDEQRLARIIGQRHVRLRAEGRRQPRLSRFELPDRREQGLVGDDVEGDGRFRHHAQHHRRGEGDGGAGHLRARTSPRR
jgi:hypothetical protein